MTIISQYIVSRSEYLDKTNAAPPTDQTPIREVKNPDDKPEILLDKAVIFDKAEFEIILLNDKVLAAKVAVYDNVGNVVFETSGRNKFVWNLTNTAGRNVANGTYLIVAEAKSARGTYACSAKVGVRK